MCTAVSLAVCMLDPQAGAHAAQLRAELVRAEQERDAAQTAARDAEWGLQHALESAAADKAAAADRLAASEAAVKAAVVAKEAALESAAKLTIGVGGVTEGALQAANEEVARMTRDMWAAREEAAAAVAAAASACSADWHLTLVACLVCGIASSKVGDLLKCSIDVKSGHWRGAGEGLLACVSVLEAAACGPCFVHARTEPCSVISDLVHVQLQPAKPTQVPRLTLTVRVLRWQLHTRRRLMHALHWMPQLQQRVQREWQQHALSWQPNMQQQGMRHPLRSGS